MRHCRNRDCRHLAEHGRFAEFLDTVSVCSDCGEPLQLGEAPPPPRSDFRALAPVYETSDRVRAHLIRSKLESEGIAVHVAGESLQGALGEIGPTMLTIRLLVSPDEVSRGREIIAGLEAAATR